MSARRKPRLVPVEAPPIRLRFGIGSEEGFDNVEAEFGFDPSLPHWYEFGWRIKPLPFESGTVDALYSAFHFHRLPRACRLEFMNEAYRILKPGSQLMLVVPHAFSFRAISDPMAQWPPLCESSFMVYSKTWREGEGMTGLNLTCDFGASYGYGHTGHPDLAVRNEEFVAHAKEHEVNWILDLHVTLTKEPAP